MILCLYERRNRACFKQYTCLWRNSEICLFIVGVECKRFISELEIEVRGMHSDIRSDVWSYFVGTKIPFGKCRKTGCNIHRMYFLVIERRFFIVICPMMDASADSQWNFFEEIFALQSMAPCIFIICTGLAVI